VAVDFNTFATTSVSDAVVTGPFTLPSGALRAGENVIAVEVHQINAGSSDIVFGCELKLEGGNVPALTPGLANNVVQDLPEFPPVYVGEIVPRNVTGLKDGAGERESWIEIVNRGDEPVSLEGWTLSNATSDLGRWTFPVGTVLKPRSATVIIADGQTLQGLGSEWHTTFVLDPAQGVVLLSRPQPGGLAVVDYLRYRDVPEDRAVVADATGLPGVGRIADPTPGVDDAGPDPNRAPQFGALGDQAVVFGGTLALQLVGSDPDPGQGLRFELVSGPAGLTVSPQGRVDWTPGPAQIGAFEIQVRVVDDGTPPLAATAGFVCRVRSASAPAMSAVLDGETLVLGVPTTPGVVYRVEVQSGLESPTWTLLREFNGTGAVEPVRDPVAGERRFYRVVVP
ncbi:MAG: lamin tail domain-containing protein, partial [Verrucomicrobiota bacterium]